MSIRRPAGSNYACHISMFALFSQVEVKEGELECPESGRKFNITNGIPNMLLHEDEV